MIDCDDTQYDFTFAHREEGFDEHISKSIRGYDLLVEDVVSYSRNFVEPYCGVVDLGCSTGNLLEKMYNHNKEHVSDVNYVGLELATGFRDQMYDRQVSVNDPNFNLEVADVRDYPIHDTYPTLVTSLFTLQFMPKSDRRDVIRSVYNALEPGGAFIFAEKTVCDDSRMQDMMTFNYYDFKSKSFTADDILEKERTLRHMLKPNTWDEIWSMVTVAGFRTIQPFWRNHMFVGAIALK